MKCDICGKEIELESQIFRLQFGKFEKDDFNGRAFKDTNYHVDQYMHFNCYMQFKVLKK